MLYLNTLNFRAFCVFLPLTLVQPREVKNGPIMLKVGTLVDWMMNCGLLFYLFELLLIVSSSLEIKGGLLSMTSEKPTEETSFRGNLQ